MHALKEEISDPCIAEKDSVSYFTSYSPFPSTPTRLFISTLVLLPNPSFHSTLHIESGKHVGLYRHWVLQWLNCLHRTS